MLIPVEEIHEFKNHPFKVRIDEDRYGKDYAVTMNDTTNTVH